jgi:ATP-dependent exoDNAse (exonuclease V) beta subunit
MNDAQKYIICYFYSFSKMESLHAERDSLVQFNEEEHKYYVNGNAMNTSVTTVVHQYFEPFDKTRTARMMLRGRNFWVDDEKYSKYWNLVKGLKEDKAVAVIVKFWDDDGAASAALGTQMHASIEDYYVSGAKLPDTEECRMFSQFNAYTIELGYYPVKSEQIVWDLDYSLAGSVDMLYRNKNTGAYWLVDWKRSKEIKFSGYNDKKGLGPLDDKQDCNFEHYSLQLNIYKFLLEKNYNIPISRMSLVILHPNNNNYILLDASNNQGAVAQIMNERAKIFKTS